MTDKSKENIVKHGIVRPKDMSLTDNSNQAFLPGIWNVVHSYMQCIKSLSAISYKM